MSTNRSMSRGATGDFGSRGGTQNFSDAGSGWTSDNSRESTVFPVATPMLHLHYYTDCFALQAALNNDAYACWLQQQVAMPVFACSCVYLVWIAGHPPGNSLLHLV